MPRYQALAARKVKHLLRLSLEYTILTVTLIKSEAANQAPRNAEQLRLDLIRATPIAPWAPWPCLVLQYGAAVGESKRGPRHPLVGGVVGATGGDMDMGGK